MTYQSTPLGNPRYQANPIDYGVGDFNGDGVEDLIFAGPSWGEVESGWDGVQWSPVVAISDGVGSYSVSVADNLTPTVHARFIEAGDLTGNGRADFFFFDTGHDVSPYAGGPNAAYLSNNGTLVNATIPTFSDYSHGGDIGDVDGDGDLDIFSLSMSGYNSTVLLNNGQGVFTATTVGITGAIKEPSWFTGSYEKPHNLITDTLFVSARLEDYTGDGLVDLLVGGHAYTHSFVAKNLGGGIFDLANASELPGSAFFTGTMGTNEQLVEAIAIDLNGDGLNDVVTSYTTANYSARAFHAFVNNGDATFRNESAARFPNGDNVDTAGQWAPDFELTDFNNDGHLDICVIYGSLEQANHQSYAGSPVTNIPVIMLNDGAGRFSLLTGNDIGLGNIRMIPVTGGYIHHDVGVYSAAGDYLNYRGVSELYFMSGSYGTAKDGKDGAVFGAAGFNEAYYLNSNEDVKALVEGGKLSSGLEHFLSSGRDEGRLGMAPGTKITGTANDELIVASSGGEVITAGAGSDTLSGGAGNDLVYGNKDTDRIVGGSGVDTLFGGQQSDTVFGLSGADQVYGNKQNDTLHGGLGDDSLFGGQQDDLLYGQFGNDRIDGNRGNDMLYGEDGIDTFVISKGDDWVMDFNTAQDKIETADAYSAVTQSVSSGNLILTDSDGDTLTLLGVTSTLSEGYFV